MLGSKRTDSFGADLCGGLICLLLILCISVVTYLYLVTVKTEIAEMSVLLCVTESLCLAVT